MCSMCKAYVFEVNGGLACYNSIEQFKEEIAFRRVEEPWMKVRFLWCQFYNPLDLEGAKRIFDDVQQRYRTLPQGVDDDHVPGDDNQPAATNRPHFRVR